MHRCMGFAIWSAFWRVIRALLRVLDQRERGVRRPEEAEAHIDEWRLELSTLRLGSGTSEHLRVRDE